MLSFFIELLGFQGRRDIMKTPERKRKLSVDDSLLTPPKMPCDKMTCEVDRNSFVCRNLDEPMSPPATPVNHQDSSDHFSNCESSIPHVQLNEELGTLPFLQNETESKPSTSNEFCDETERQPSSSDELITLESTTKRVIYSLKISDDNFEKLLEENLDRLQKLYSEELKVNLVYSI